MNPDLSIEADVIGKVETLMLKNHPVVPPTSVIKTFSHLKAGQVDLIMTQDKTGLAPGSFIVRRGEWGKFFLDTWFDPLYRSYNFQKAETHALVRPLYPKMYQSIWLTETRNTSCNGTRPSYRSWPSSRRGSSMHIARKAPVRMAHTLMETSSSVFLAATRIMDGNAKSKQMRFRNGGGQFSMRASERVDWKTA